MIIIIIIIKLSQDTLHIKKRERNRPKAKTPHSIGGSGVTNEVLLKQAETLSRTRLSEDGHQLQLPRRKRRDREMVRETEERGR